MCDLAYCSRRDNFSNGRMVSIIPIVVHLYGIPRITCTKAAMRKVLPVNNKYSWPVSPHVYTLKPQ